MIFHFSIHQFIRLLTADGDPGEVLAASGSGDAAAAAAASVDEDDAALRARCERAWVAEVRPQPPPLLVRL